MRCNPTSFAHLRCPGRAALLGLVLLSATPARAAGDDPGRWEAAIRRFEARDREAPPSEGGIVFVGSSSIRLWDVERSFPDLTVLRRGFGGSHLADCVQYAGRIVLPYRPRTVVLYAGDNDIEADKTPRRVHYDFLRFVDRVHGELPHTRIVFIAIKPSIARWDRVEAMRRANELIRATCDRHARLVYIDIDTPMLGDDGRPRPELFAGDGLHLSEAGYDLWSSLVRPHLGVPARRAPPSRASGAEASAGESEGVLRVATCGFPVSRWPSANAIWIRKQMREARRAGADLIHFPEAALGGYPGVDYDPAEHSRDWRRIARELGSVRKLARELGVWVVLGSDHRLRGEDGTGPKPHNALYVIGPRGEIVDRYDKRFCTGGDLRHYTPGDRAVVFEAKGVRCALLICYDVRFPELYRHYCELGVDLVLQSFHNARQRKGVVHPVIMPASLRTRAATNGFFVSAANSSARRSWPGLFATPDGRIRGRLPANRPGVMVNVVDLSREYYDASRPYRLDAIRGKWHSGETAGAPGAGAKGSP